MVPDFGLHITGPAVARSAGTCVGFFSCADPSCDSAVHSRDPGRYTGPASRQILTARHGSGVRVLCLGSPSVQVASRHLGLVLTKRSAPDSRGSLPVRSTTSP